MLLSFLNFCQIFQRFYIEEKLFCARARRIHLWIYRARARNRFSSLYRGKKVCARARRIHLWVYRTRARNRFSSLYRGETLRPEPTDLFAFGNKFETGNWRCGGGGAEALRRHLNFRQISHRFTSSFYPSLFSRSERLTYYVLKY